MENIAFLLISFRYRQIGDKSEKKTSEKGVLRTRIDKLSGLRVEIINTKIKSKITTNRRKKNQ